MGYFGVCPECGDDDGYLNIGSSHYGVCEKHKAYWPIGSNLFSCWQDEDESLWEANAQRLGGYREVEPAEARSTDVLAPSALSVISEDEAGPLLGI